ncbi:sialidase family protein [Rubritalea tangerina]|uniref:Sialidase family protein n=1 Tax=Rubritalea tangerina TaxID=430798 RepID=A0ABW4ZE38_9BACT
MRLLLISFCLAQSLFTQAETIRPPYKVGTPPADAGRGLVRVSPNEIRHYPGKGGTRYILSLDNGATWSSKPLPPSYPGSTLLKKETSAITPLPTPDSFLKIEPAYRGDNPKQGMFVTYDGLDGSWKKLTKPDGSPILPKGILRNPIVFNQGKRWLIPAHSGGCFTYFSDDQGKSWQRSNKVNAPAHKPGGVHLGSRWNHGMVGATLAELKDGRIWMLARTAQDFFYESFSDDHGTSWSPAQPSRFHGNNVLGTLLRLDDGRLLFLWNNANSLPELARANNGREDVFNNRDAAHAAISEDDGKTWIGFREIALDHRRNESDYAVFQGSNDRGVQQVEALQLDKNRVLLSLGQHPTHRQLLILNLRWLYQTERQSDFTSGAQDWSTHQFFSKVRGHLGYNRTPGPKVVTRDGHSALHLIHTDDPEILNNKQGATWNFPSATAGTLSTRLMLEPHAGGTKICLLDHWLNPTDTTVDQFSQFALHIDAQGKSPDGTPLLTPGKWQTLTFQWDQKSCTVSNDSGSSLKLPLNLPTSNGVSYIHFSTTSETPTTKGLLIQNTKMTASP